MKDQVHARDLGGGTAPMVNPVNWRANFRGTGPRLGQPKTSSTAAKERIPGTLKLNRHRRPQITASHFPDVGREGPSRQVTPSMYTGGADCADGLIDIADEQISHIDELAYLESLTEKERRDVYTEMLQRRPALKNDAVMRDMLKQSDATIIANRGEIIGGDVVKGLWEHHKQVDRLAYDLRRSHFAPDQPLINRYQQEKLLDDVQPRKYERGQVGAIENDAFEPIHVKEPAIKDRKTQQKPGPRIEFKDPAHLRNPETWETTAEVWDKARLKAAKGKDVSIYGVQRAGRGQMGWANRDFEIKYNYSKNNLALHNLRSMHKDIVGQLKQTNDPRKREKLERKLKRVNERGKEVAELIRRYHDPAVKKPGDMDAPDGGWSLDSLRVKAFDSKEKAEAWIKVNEKANPGIVFKPYEHTLKGKDAHPNAPAAERAAISVSLLRDQIFRVKELLAKDSHKAQSGGKILERKIEKLNNEIRVMQARGENEKAITRKKTIRQKHQSDLTTIKKDPEGAGKQRLQGILRSLENAIEAQTARLNQATKDGRPKAKSSSSVVLKWDDRFMKFGPHQVAEARNFYRHLKAGKKNPSFEWAPDHILEYDKGVATKATPFGDLALRQAAGDPAPKTPAPVKTQRLAELIIDDERLLTNELNKGIFQAMATTAKERGKKVSLRYVETDESPSVFKYGQRQNKRIQLKSGQTMPATYLIKEGRENEFAEIVRRVDGITTPIIKGVKY